MKPIMIADYGMGNLRSVQKAFERMGYAASISSSPQEILGASGVVLPGVGAFGDAMECLNRTGLADTVRTVADAGTPLLGVCLGLQLLFDGSEETFDGSPSIPGLGIIPGRVVKFEGLSRELKVPQIGWNSVEKTDNPGLFANIPEGSYFYFVHSYFIEPTDPGVVSTYTDYGVRFASSVSWKNVNAAQFHPEKSSRWGLELLGNFGRMVEECC